jgi:glycerol-3-phosphate O-acyltransferase/dihydroxyacetone phosphate acyltransferase
MNTYRLVKAFASYSTDILFRDIDVINAEEIPREGPMIIYGNHNNQFIDGMVLYVCDSAAIKEDTTNH